MRTLTTLLLLPALMAGAAAVILWTGQVDFSAARPAGPLEERLARLALDHSIRRHAPRIANPLAGSPDAAREGMRLFRSQCVACHGAPGVDATEAGASLNPPAPGLTLPRVQARRDAALYWIVSRGIRMTGMPAFGASHSEREIWQLVAAIRRLPRLTSQERRALGAER